MLPTTKFFLAEMAILFFVAVIQVIGITETISIFRRSFPRFKNLVAPAVVVAAAFVHLPFIYWMILYKTMLVTFSTAGWNALWLVCFTGGSAVFTLGLYALLRKISFKKAVKAETIVPVQAEIIPAIHFPEVFKAPVITHRRNFLKTTAIAAAGTLVSGSILKSAETDDLVIEDVILPVRNLAPQHEGLTIGMLSDVHSSPFMLRDEMEFFRKKLEGLKTDMIFLPGDFVNSQTREVYPFAEAFAGMSAPYGVYGVTGNHDYFSREIEIVTQEVEQAGIKLIRNSNIALDIKGATLHLLGVDDPDASAIGEYLENGKTKTGAIESVVKGLPEKETRILLCHKPYYFEGYAKLNIDLVLSGHTHGGQIVWANFQDSNLSFAGIVSDYIAGKYPSRRNPRSTMYVGRGIGSVGVPFRLNCPPEITRIALARA